MYLGSLTQRILGQVTYDAFIFLQRWAFLFILKKKLLWGRGENLCCSQAVWPAGSLALTEALCWWWGVWSTPCAFETPAAAGQQTSIHQHIGWVSTIHKHWYTVLYSALYLDLIMCFTTCCGLSCTSAMWLFSLPATSCSDGVIRRSNWATAALQRGLKKEQPRTTVIKNFKSFQVRLVEKYLEI